ncbi:beta-Ala-His dipeptidase [Halotalea alkalilenta]|uniref:beta-Ala-His dipeptidase n=1 Tax=Halotalea alkalilenta TaxID=376489 RepID=UPI0004824A46|nr:beta-Ala-His dipeptidase [Halotalea alkalilenta]
MSAVSPNAHLDQLSPAPLWRHFRMLCDTPRPSGQEEAVMRNIVSWAERRGFSTSRDQAGNLLVRRPASPGFEAVPMVTLQSHVDMVSQADVEHDFSRDPILTEVRDGWLWARGTTLGADNGIGAAAALAILDDDELAHGPLEALFTVAEETSLVGATQLAPNWLEGRYLLNLDSEDRGEVYIGCAGGVHVGLEERFEIASLESGWTVARLSLDGLKGGHSGVDIHQQLGSANRLLPRALLTLLDGLGSGALRLLDYHGGTMGNAITRSASALVALPAASFDDALERIATLEATLRTELAVVEQGLALRLEPEEYAGAALGAQDSARVVRLLAALPYGVERYSDEIEGTVETSNNLGIVALEEGALRLDTMIRSLRDSAALALAARIEALCRLGGFAPKRSSFYPGWTPSASSPLLTRFEELHQRIEGHAPQIKVIHAGLECGIIGAKYPQLEMISFGPTIRGAHSPSERVELAAVEAFWALLRGMIASLAERPLSR